MEHEHASPEEISSNSKMVTIGHASSQKNAYVTLLTLPRYLAGALLLAYTLHKHSPDTPLIIMYTPETLTDVVTKAITAESDNTNIILHPIERLRLAEDDRSYGVIAERFIDSWTKLRVFDLNNEKEKFDQICFLDADMMVFANPSPLIFNPANDAYLRGDDGVRIMATHDCVCNLHNASWAPKSWNPKNCAFTHLTSSSQIPGVKDKPHIIGLFNAGAFTFRPSAKITEFVQRKFKAQGIERLKGMKLADQEFLNEAFHSRWASLSWKVNALKTGMYSHPNIWHIDKVAILHYIIDKPWATRIKPGGTAGYLGRDGETHRWWWAEFNQWRKEKTEQNSEELLNTVAKFMAREDGQENEQMRGIGSGVQSWAKKQNR